MQNGVYSFNNIITYHHECQSSTRQFRGQHFRFCYVSTGTPCSNIKSKVWMVLLPIQRPPPSRTLLNYLWIIK